MYLTLPTTTPHAAVADTLAALPWRVVGTHTSDAPEAGESFNVGRYPTRGDLERDLASLVTLPAVADGDVTLTVFDSWERMAYIVNADGSVTVGR